MIIVGTDNGSMVDFEITEGLLESLQNKAEKHRNNPDAKIERTIIESSYLYPHGNEWHEGYIDSVHVLGQDATKENPMNNKIGTTSNKNRI